MCPFSRKEWQWWSWSWCVCVVCACAGLRHVHFAYINRADRLWKQEHHAPAFTVHGHERVRRWRQWLKHADVSFYRGEGYESLSCGLGVWPMSGIAGRKIWIPGWQKSTNDRKKDVFGNRPGRLSEDISEHIIQFEIGDVRQFWARFFSRASIFVSLIR